MAGLIARLGRWWRGARAPAGPGRGGDARDADAPAEDAPAEDAPAEDALDAGALDADAVIAPALTDELDLHTFQPREVASVVDEYLHQAQAAGLAQVRVVHGKGRGVLREIVHGVLRRHPAAATFALADERRGGWGATIVTVRPRAVEQVGTRAG